MCSQFLLKTSLNEITSFFAQPIFTATNAATHWDTTFRGFLKTDLAPVLIAENNQLQLRPMYFSLCPSWSKEFPFQWTTYNARMQRPNPKQKNTDVPSIENIYEVPSWR